MLKLLNSKQNISTITSDIEMMISKIKTTSIEFFLLVTHLYMTTNTPYTFDKIIENKLKITRKTLTFITLIPGANISNYLKTLIQ